MIFQNFYQFLCKFLKGPLAKECKNTDQFRFANCAQLVASRSMGSKWLPFREILKINPLGEFVKILVMNYLACLNFDRLWFEGP